MHQHFILAYGVYSHSFRITLSASALSDDDFVPVTNVPETTAVETSVNNYDSEILYEEVPLDVPTTVEDKIEFETEEPAISVPADNTIEYDEPQIEIPDTGSKNPFSAVTVCMAMTRHIKAPLVG